MKRLFLLLLCACPLLVHGDDLPDLGDASQSLLSPQQERQLGEQTMLQIRASQSYLDDPEINDYLNALGARLTANSPEPSQEFEFFAIDDSAVNAFALPGGFIGVNTGLILTAQSESELASVLAHEIAHVTQHHLARMIAGRQYDSLAAMTAIAAAILAARSNPQAAAAAIVGAQGGMMQRQLNFTRSHEEEADRIGIAILAKSGFDVRAMPAFFERMQRATRLLEGNAPAWLRTHPVTAERIADVGNRVHQFPYRLVGDSLDFQLVRARLIALQRPPQEAIAYFKGALGEQKFGNPVAHRYGLVLALLRNKQEAEARAAFTALEQEAPDNAMITALAGQLLQQGAPAGKTARFYRDAVRNFPQYRALVYDHVAALLAEKQYEEALKLLGERINQYPNDPRLYDLQARAYTALGRMQEAHHALAYTYILQGNLYGAIDQLELAKAAGDNFYELSVIETELRRFREIAAAQQQKRRR